MVAITLSPPGVTKQASSPINLTCSVSGNFSASLTYEWSSTCTGNCFILQAMVPMLTKSSLHSVDSGNHTCTVSDSLGYSGSSTIEIKINGELLSLGNYLK